MVLILEREGTKKCALEATRTESFTQKSFMDLINDSFTRRRDYYLARVRCQGNGSDVVGVYYCYDAKQLCRHIFEMIIGHNGRKIRVKSFKDPIHQRTIAELSFFRIRYAGPSPNNVHTNSFYNPGPIPENRIGRSIYSFGGKSTNSTDSGNISSSAIINSNDVDMVHNYKSNGSNTFFTDIPPLHAEYIGNHVDFLESNSFRSKIFADEDAFDALSVTFDFQKKYHPAISKRKLVGLILSILFIFGVTTFVVFTVEKRNINFFGKVEHDYGSKNQQGD